MDKSLKNRALAINKRRQELVNELSALANTADTLAEEIQEFIDDHEGEDEDDQDPDFDVTEHENAYANVVEWQEALEQAAELLDI